MNENPGLSKCRKISLIEQTQRKLLTEFRRLDFTDTTTNGGTEFSIFGRLIVILNNTNHGTKLVVMVLNPDQQGFNTFQFTSNGGSERSGHATNPTVYPDHTRGLEAFHEHLILTLQAMSQSVNKSRRQAQYGHWRFCSD